MENRHIGNRDSGSFLHCHRPNRLQFDNYFQMKHVVHDFDRRGAVRHRKTIDEVSVVIAFQSLFIIIRHSDRRLNICEQGNSLNENARITKPTHHIFFHEKKQIGRNQTVDRQLRQTMSHYAQPFTQQVTCEYKLKHRMGFFTTPLRYYIRSV